MTVTVDAPDLHIVTEGLRFPEGPVCMPDGSVALVEIEADAVVDSNGDRHPADAHDIESAQLLLAALHFELVV